jgi:hypothetical protein
MKDQEQPATKYLLFGGDHYCPDPGVEGLVDHGGITDLDELIEFANTVKIKYQGKLQWWQIVDHATMKVVAQSDNDYL